MVMCACISVEISGVTAILSTNADYIDLCCNLRLERFPMKRQFPDFETTRTKFKPLILERLWCSRPLLWPHKPTSRWVARRPSWIGEQVSCSSTVISIPEKGCSITSYKTRIGRKRAKWFVWWASRSRHNFSLQRIAKQITQGNAAEMCGNNISNPVPDFIYNFKFKSKIDFFSCLNPI